MSQGNKLFFYSVATFGSILSFLHDLDHYQTIAMTSDRCTEADLRLLKFDLQIKQVDKLQASPVSTTSVTPLYKFIGSQVVLLYQTFEKAYHLVSAMGSLLHLIEGDFRKPSDAQTWHKGMVNRHAHFKKYLLKNIPIKYRESLLGIPPRVPSAAPKERADYLYIHTLDGFPAYFDGKTVVQAGTDRNAKGAPHRRLRSIKQEHELAARHVSAQFGEDASQQFQTRLGYVIFLRPQRPSL